MKITIIGAANIDIIAGSKVKIQPGESNNAEINIKASGVARNIAAMLAIHKVDVSLIAAVGNDPFGILLKESCESIGINTEAWIIKNNTSTGVYLAAHENTGELYAGFSATAAVESIKTSELLKHKALINEADLLLLDLNLSEKIIALALEQREDGPVMVNAVSVDKVLRVEKFLDRINILKLNRLEAEKLTGITLDTKERVKQAGFNIVNRGVQRVFITLGMAGVCAVDSTNAVFIPALPVVVKDLSGAGDAFSAGLAMKYTKKLKSQAESGVAFAAEHLSRNV